MYNNNNNNELIIQLYCPPLLTNDCYVLSTNGRHLERVSCRFDRTVRNAYLRPKRRQCVFVDNEARIMSHDLVRADSSIRRQTGPAPRWNCKCTSSSSSTWTLTRGGSTTTLHRASSGTSESASDVRSGVYAILAAVIDIYDGFSLYNRLTLPTCIDGRYQKQS